jgi:hypothetical protein
MLADAYRHADDPTSRHLADRLAEPWRGVLAATVREAQAGDDDALAALLRAGARSDFSEHNRCRSRAWWLIGMR